jgi:peptide/nickel transport system permease protein
MSVGTGPSSEAKGAKDTRVITSTPLAEEDSAVQQAEALKAPGPSDQLETGASVRALAVPAAAMASLPVGALPGRAGRRRGEFLYYVVRNKKLMFGLSIELIFVLAAIFGPLAAPYTSAGDSSPAGVPLKDQCTAFFCSSGLTSHPSAHHLLGMTYFGGDVLSIMLDSLRETYLVGFLGALVAGFIGLALGFSAGWRGGWLDEILQLLTNIWITMPALVLLIVTLAFAPPSWRNPWFEGLFIGATSWPWVARAVRAQTFALREREFVDLARLSGKRGPSIVIKDIAPNMASYLFLVFVLLFAGAMLISVSYDFLGLGPANVVSLGDMMNSAMIWSALNFKAWWWFIPPGAAMTLIVAALYISNIGLDEVFNPKLRES